MQEINKEIERQMSANLKLQFTNSRMPDLQWLTFVLAALNPKHKFFAKSFYPDKPNDPQMIIKLEQLKNNGQLQHSFFQGLPMHLVLKRKSLKGFANAVVQPQVSTFHFM